MHISIYVTFIPQQGGYRGGISFFISLYDVITSKKRSVKRYGGGGPLPAFQAAMRANDANTSYEQAGLRYGGGGIRTRVL
jgi:hypothetical protein